MEATPRHRLSDGTVPVPCIHTIRRNGYANATDSFNGGLSGPYREMWDVVVPNFKRRSEAGEIFTNPLLQIAATNTMVPGKVRWKYKYADTAGRPNGEYWEGWWDHPLAGALGRNTAPEPNASVDDAITQAVTEALSKVRQPEFMGAVAMAEAKRTLEMLANPLANMRRLTASMGRAAWSAFTLRGRRTARSMASFQDALASQWLMYRYGIMPLIYDMESLLKALIASHAARETFRASVRVAPVITTSNGSCVPPANSPLAGIATVSYTETLTQSATVRASILTQYSSTCTSEYGVGLLDTPEAALELVPYSFVADWLVNLSSFVGSLRLGAEAHHLNRVLTIEKVSTRQRVTTGATRGSGWSSDWTITHDAASSDYMTYLHKSRRSFTSDERGLVFRPNITWQRALDAIALTSRVTSRAWRLAADAHPDKALTSWQARKAITYTE